MNRFRIAVVEDEPLARGMIRDLLAGDAEAQWVGEAADGRSGRKLIRETTPDIVFLDIEMPEVGGLDLAADLGVDPSPAVVFVTAFGRYATEAFDVNALDYVVKPFSDRRFFRALERAKKRVRQRRLSDLAQRVAGEASEIAGPAADEESEEPVYTTVIPVRRNGRSKLVRTRDLLWIESQDYYARLHEAGRSILVRTSLAAFEKTLDPKRFARVHRGAIVNLDRVVEIEHPGNGTCVLVLSDGSRCRVSRSRRRQVEELIERGPHA